MCEFLLSNSLALRLDTAMNVRERSGPFHHTPHTSVYSGRPTSRSTMAENPRSVSTFTCMIHCLFSPFLNPKPTIKDKESRFRKYGSVTKGIRGRDSFQAIGSCRKAVSESNRVWPFYKTQCNWFDLRCTKPIIPAYQPVRLSCAK